ncbi:MAG: hypothetical protein Q8T13_13690, partial [Acidobacteriota bacterium]|nr:hypothetical protein [Acidobacteriota bacterium]
MSAKKKSKATRSGKSPVRKKTAASPRSGPGSSAPAAVAADPKTPIHQWTNGGSRVLILRCGEVGYNGFQWPTTVGATVVAPDPDRRPVCGGGLHGWPWGLAFGEGKEPDWTVKWLVFAADPADVILLEGKVKCVGPVEIVHVGSMLTAWNFVLAGQMAWSHYYADGAPASSSGDGAPASSSGDGAPASSSGTRAPASSSGDGAPASSSGTRAPASSSGDGAPASSSGDGAP